MIFLFKKRATDFFRKKDNKWHRKVSLHFPHKKIKSFGKVFQE
jgi:hypothetical protein